MNREFAPTPRPVRAALLLAALLATALTVGTIDALFDGQVASAPHAPATVLAQR